MKNIFVLIALLLSVNVNASLISFSATPADYNPGDEVIFDVYLNSANPALSWLETEYAFDNSLLAFDSFIENDDVTYLNNILYSDVGMSFFDSSLLSVLISFNDNWSAELSTSFKLGQASFFAEQSLVNFSTISLTPAFSYAEDATGNEISPTEVPEPPAIALLAFGLFALTRLRKA